MSDVEKLQSTFYIIQHHKVDLHKIELYKCLRHFIVVFILSRKVTQCLRRLTEKIEEEIQKVFPESKVSRMDFDTTRTKKAYENIISAFQNKKSNILVGTQMISKGLDFDNVNVVGILSADSMMNYPDFRSHEKAFQMMAQVAGRAGRKNSRGEVILQTSEPNHPLIRQVIHNDYVGMYMAQLREREMFRYPPFYRLKIGRASCRERVSSPVSLPVVRAP